MIGLGDLKGSCINVYIANRPPLDEYQFLDEIRPLREGEVAYIAQETGNHWRKIFNVFAKFIYALELSTLKADQRKIEPVFKSWQAYRDEQLLQKGSSLRLVFTSPELQDAKKSNTIQIIMGKQYAIDLGFHEDQHEGMVRLDSDFVIWPDKKIIICPYFDYRQLSNIKIDRLVELVQSINGNN